MSTEPIESQLPLPAPTAPNPGRAVLWAILAALLASVAAWLIGEVPSIWVAPKKVPKITMGTPGLLTTEETVRAAISTNSARLQGIFGASIGLALGLAGGLASRRPFRLGPPLVGLVLGGVAGFLVTTVAVPLYFRWLDPKIEELIPATILLGSIASVIGLTSALAFGLGAGDGRASLIRSAIGGVLGALIGTAIYETVGAAFFSNDEPGEPISKTAVTRLLARLLIALFIAIGVSTGPGRRQSSSSTAMPGASPGRSG